MRYKEILMTENTSGDNILDLIRSSFQVHSVILFLPTNDGNYTLVSSSTEHPPYPEEVIIPPGKGLVGWILRHQQPLILNNFDQKQGYLGYYLDMDENYITSFMGCHLPGGGALCIDSATNHIFTEADQQLLTRFARLIIRQMNSMGTVNDNQRLRRYYEGLEGLIELHEETNWGNYLSLFLNLIKNVTDSDYSAFVSSAEGSSTYTLEGESTPLIFPNHQSIPEFSLVTGGLIGWVFRNEVPVYAEGTDGSSTSLFGKISYVPNFQSIICLPVITNKVTCGVICLANHAARRLPQEMKTFIRLATASLAHYLDIIALRYRFNKLLPHATVHRSGAIFYDPDLAPLTPNKEE